MIPITCNAVGDILALATLVVDVARALNDARGSSSEYRSFIHELNAVHAMLTSAARIAEDSIDGALRDQIIRTVDQCGGDIQRALARLAKFSTLGCDGVAGDGLRLKLKRNWYKVEWRFLQRDEAQTFQKELTMATQRLTTLLVISDADGAVRFRKNLLRQVDASVARDAVLLRAIDGNTTLLHKLDAIMPSRGHTSAVEELSSSVPDGVDSRTAAIGVLCGAVCAMHAPYDRMIPTALLLVAIYILSRAPGRHRRALVGNVAYSALNAVTLHDAMGRRLVLPLALCETRELFHATLVNLFSRTDGHWFISSHRYGIMVKGEARYIGDRDNWTLRPGTEVEMTIIVQSAFNVAADVIHCPVCLVTTAKSMTYPNYVCSVCGRELKGYCVAPSQLGISVDDALERAPLKERPEPSSTMQMTPAGFLERGLVL
ncbi:hypothetical protein PENSPDRAFT_274540 [Peniophora sp. CONT]|nr:hypothetical protein PENSPDRAFT_274540 [Peniophora sp. CONT]